MTGRTMTIPSTEELAAFWQRLGKKRQAVCCWDVEDGQRLDSLTGALESFGCLAMRDEAGQIFQLGWLRPLWPGSATAMAHFASAGTRGQALGSWPGFADFARQRGFALLLAFLPQPFRHARALARECGFEPCCVMPRAAWLASHKRLVDAELLSIRIACPRVSMRGMQARLQGA